MSQIRISCALTRKGVDTITCPPGTHSSRTFNAALQGSGTCPSTCSQITTSNRLGDRLADIELGVHQAGVLLPVPPGVGVAADLRGAEALWPEGVEVGVHVLVEDDALPVLGRLDRMRIADRVRDTARAPNDVAKPGARRTQGISP